MTGVRLANDGVHTNNTSVTVKAQKPAPMIIFLTDGDPTVGEVDLDVILKKLSESTTGPKSAAVFSLAFGDDADRHFLQKISLRNKGLMRHIYEDADATDQLLDFYRQVSSPLLYDVKFVYPKEQVEPFSLSRNVFPTLFGGSELVVAGKLRDKHRQALPTITGEAADGPWACEFQVDNVLQLPMEPKTKFGPLEKMWAYLTIKQLLDAKDADEVIMDDPEEDGSRGTPKDQALRIALKYSFVTPLTSLVVVKPNDASSAVDAESVNPAKGQSPLNGANYNWGSSGSSSLVGQYKILAIASILGFRYCFMFVL